MYSTSLLTYLSAIGLFSSIYFYFSALTDQRLYDIAVWTCSAITAFGPQFMPFLFGSTVPEGGG